jgi:beta-glucosidase
MSVSSAEVPTNGLFEVEVTLTNTGDRDGVEVAQLYFEDPVAEIARPVIQLLGFARVDLKSGQSKRVKFSVSTDRLAYTGVDYKRIVDSGIINLSVGSSRSNLHSTHSIKLIGETYFVPFDRVMRTPATIE